MQPNDSQLPLCGVRNQVPGLIAPGLERWWRTSSSNALHMLMVRPSAMPNVADFSNLAPAHRRELKMKVNNELADLIPSCNLILHSEMREKHHGTESFLISTELIEALAK